MWFLRMKKNIHRSEQRGEAKHDWLHSRFSFSFADYNEPSRMGFGKLRVLNDDTIAPGKGFGTHPHNNMEIISIPLFGELAHKDNTGKEEVIVPGQIQVMSAGSGILHSEYNHSKEKEVKLFQIWIETSKQNVEPRHETRTLHLEKNKLIKVVSGNKETLFIYQDASIWLGEFDSPSKLSFETTSERGTFIMVIEGSAVIEDEVLNERDSIEISDTTKINIEADKGTKLLVIDTVM